MFATIKNIMPRKTSVPAATAKKVKASKPSTTSGASKSDTSNKRVAEEVTKAVLKNSTKTDPKTTAKSTNVRRFTPASYGSRFKRRRAERNVARTKTPNSFIIFGRSVKMLRNHWEVFGGIALIYIILNTILVGGLLGSNELQQQKESLADFFTGQFSKLGTGLTLFSFLVTSNSGLAGGISGTFQTVLLLLTSLAVVWSLRQFYAGNSIRIRDAFYDSTYPLVQLILVLLAIIVQLLPAAAGIFLFKTLVMQNVLITGWQQAIASLICFLLVFWTIYLLCASLFAAYIITLPGMTPLQAFRSAKDIVQYRRAVVLRKLLVLPLILLLVSGLIMVPLTILYTPAAPAVFFVLSALALPVTHSYMYGLYRELIQ
jgi:hypothetical protein